jgi:hypothetical protein
MTFHRAHLCQWTAIWVTAVLLSSPQLLAVDEKTDAFPAATPESQGISTAAVRRLADEVEEYFKNGTIVGGELLIIKNRKTILHEARSTEIATAKTNARWSPTRSSTSAR